MFNRSGTVICAQCGAHMRTLKVAAHEAIFKCEVEACSHINKIVLRRATLPEQSSPPPAASVAA